MAFSLAFLSFWGLGILCLGNPMGLGFCLCGTIIGTVALPTPTTLADRELNFTSPTNNLDSDHWNPHESTGRSTRQAISMASSFGWMVTSSNYNKRGRIPSGLFLSLLSSETYSNDWTCSNKLSFSGICRRWGVENGGD